MNKLAIAAFAATLILPVQARAADYSLLLMGPSYHSIATSVSGVRLNNATYGLGGEVQFNPDSAIDFGAYRNSYSHPSVFVEYDYTPLHYGRFSAGIGAGLATGYQKFRGHGYANVVAGVLVKYNLSPSEAIEVRVLPQWRTMYGRLTKEGVIVNLAVSVKLGRLERG